MIHYSVFYKDHYICDFESLEGLYVNAAKTNDFTNYVTYYDRNLQFCTENTLFCGQQTAI